MLRILVLALGLAIHGCPAFAAGRAAGRVLDLSAGAPELAASFDRDSACARLLMLLSPG